MATSQICSVPGCDKPRGNRGYCERHYRRWLRHGDPTAGRTLDGASMEFLENVALRHQNDDCLIWPFALAGSGYPVVRFRGRMTRATRLICHKIYGPPQTGGHEAAHNCGNAKCVNHRHLRWATTKENHADKIGHGTIQRGERNGRSSLSLEQVLKIKRFLATGRYIDKDIGQMTGATRRQVNTIKLGRCWGWVE